MPLLARIEQDEQDAGSDRGAERFRLRLTSAIELGADRPSNVTILDLSSKGFLIETDAPVEVGASLSFALPVAGSVAGEIVWASGGYFGGRFDKPIEPAVLSAALAASRVVWPNFSRSSAADRQWDGEAERECETHEARLPLPARLAIIVGASVLLWSLIGAAAWLMARGLAQ
jgi:hypothetical protein